MHNSNTLGLWSAAFDGPGKHPIISSKANPVAHVLVILT
jgi:hypothetical protein